MLIAFLLEPRFYHCKAVLLSLLSINSVRKECCVRGTLNKDHVILYHKIVKESIWLPIRKQFSYIDFFPLFTLRFCTIRSLSMI